MTVEEYLAYVRDFQLRLLSGPPESPSEPTRLTQEEQEELEELYDDEDPLTLLHDLLVPTSEVTDAAIL